MKISSRSQRLVRLIHEHLPILLTRYFTPDEIGFTTISAVEVAGDLSVTDVFVSVLPFGGITTTETLEKLNKKASKLGHEIKNILKLSRPMALRFKIDKSVEHVEKMRGLL